MCACERRDVVRHVCACACACVVSVGLRNVIVIVIFVAIHCVIVVLNHYDESAAFRCVMLCLQSYRVCCCVFSYSLFFYQ